MPLDFTEFDEQEREAGIVPEDSVIQHAGDHACDFGDPTLTQLPDDGFKWPELPNKKKKLDPLPPAPIEAMPTVLRKMCNEVSETYQVPVEVPMLNALAFVGYCSGKHHTAKIGPVVVRPNLYAACFQAPAERKSSGFSPLVKPVHEWIEEQIPEWRKNASSNEIRREKIRQLKKDIVSGKCENETTARLELDKLESETDAPNPNFVMGDATQGAMADRMAECGGQVLVASSDAKSILEIVMGKFTDGATEDGLLLQAYDGTEPFISSRRQSGTVTVSEPMMGIVIMTQVNQLRKLAERGDLFSSGLISRCLFCFPDSLAGKRDASGNRMRDFSEREISEETKSQYGSLIHELLDYSSKMHSPITVPVDSDAKECWVDFYHEIEDELGPTGEYADCAEVAGRLPIHAFRLALILSICHNPANPSIGKLDMINAIKLAKYYWKHMERALGIMSKRNMPGIPRRIIRSLQGKHEHILHTSTVRNRLSKMSDEDWNDAVDWLLDNGYLRGIEVVGEHDPKGGRPKCPAYEVNPAIHSD